LCDSSRLNPRPPPECAVSVVRPRVSVDPAGRCSALAASHASAAGAADAAAARHERERRLRRAHRDGPVLVDHVDARRRGLAWQKVLIVGAAAVAVQVHDDVDRRAGGCRRIDVEPRFHVRPGNAAERIVPEAPAAVERHRLGVILDITLVVRRRRRRWRNRDRIARVVRLLHRPHARPVRAQRLTHQIGVEQIGLTTLHTVPPRGHQANHCQGSVAALFQRSVRASLPRRPAQTTVLTVSPGRSTDP
jgi:hypothetical protein